MSKICIIIGLLAISSYCNAEGRLGKGNIYKSFEIFFSISFLPFIIQSVGLIFVNIASLVLGPVSNERSGNITFYRGILFMIFHIPLFLKIDSRQFLFLKKKNKMVKNRGIENYSNLT